MTLYEPSEHYDNVTRAWKYLLGEDLHYGYYLSKETPHPEATAHLNSLMAEYGSLGECEKGNLLDVGCGTGNPGCWIASNFSIDVTGISTSPVGILQANARSDTAGLSDRARFLVRDAQDNGFDNESFDRVWVMESSHLMPDKTAMMREGARVLRSGGRLVLCDVIAIEPIPIEIVLKNAKAFNLLGKVFGRAKMETLDFYQTQIENNGMKVDLCRDISSETRPTFESWAENARLNEKEVCELIGKTALDEFRESCTVLAKFWDDRVLGYGIISGSKTDA